MTIIYWSYIYIKKNFKIWFEVLPTSLLTSNAVHIAIVLKKADVGKFIGTRVFNLKLICYNSTLIRLSSCHYYPDPPCISPHTLCERSWCFCMFTLSLSLSFSICDKRRILERVRTCLTVVFLVTCFLYFVILTCCA